MATDRWGKEVHPEFGWAVGPNSYTSIRIGREFFPDADSRIFYEENLPELRLFAWLLLDCIRLQERGAISHGKEIDPEWRDVLAERCEQLAADLRQSSGSGD